MMRRSTNESGLLEQTADDSRVAQQLLSPEYSAVSFNSHHAFPALLPGPRLRNALLSISKQAERDIELLSSSSPQARIHALRVRMKKLCALRQLIKPDIAPAI